MKRPSFQFYPSDWLRDTSLRVCSLEARGLWMDMICYMHEGNPYGHLRVSSKHILAPILARMVGVSLEKCEGLLLELEHAGVFSKTEDGTIFSRRMIKDETLRSARASGGFESLKNPNVPKKKDVLKGYPSTPSLDPSPSSSSSSSSSSLKKEEVASLPAPTLTTKQLAAKEVIDYLNVKTGGTLPPHLWLLKPIVFWLDQNYSVADCKLVIDSKVADWGKDPAFAKNLVPSVLFKLGKFLEYLSSAKLSSVSSKPVIRESYDELKARGVVQ